MPLTPAQILEVQAFSAADMRQAVDVYNQQYATLGGVALDLNTGSAWELRVLDILSQFLPAQLAATPLISPSYQSMADRLNANIAGGIDPQTAGYESTSSWTTSHPPAVQTFAFGDMNNAVDKQNLPAIVVSSTLPGGEDMKRGTLGPTQDTEFTTYIYYVLPYNSSLKRQLEAMRGAEAVAAILARFPQDPVMLWMNGRVNFIQRNVSALRGQDGPAYVTGIVQFSAWVRRSYTPIIAT